MKGLFVAGTDTNVGKTILTGAIAAYLKKNKIQVGVMKPIESGSLERSDALFLKKMASVDDPLDLINPYFFEAPLAPAIAAQLEKKEILLDRIFNSFQKLFTFHSLLLVEGAGGLFVPLTKEKTILDLIQLLQLPVLLVARAGLGTINHTLLSIEALKTRKVQIAGVILNHTTPEADLSSRYNFETLKEWTDIPIWGEFPYLKNIEDENLMAQIIGSRFNPFLKSFISKPVS